MRVLILAFLEFSDRLVEKFEVLGSWITLFTWNSAQHSVNEGELVEIGPAGKDGLSNEHFDKKAAD